MESDHMLKYKYISLTRVYYIYTCIWTTGLSWKTLQTCFSMLLVLQMMCTDLGCSYKLHHTILRTWETWRYQVSVQVTILKVLHRKRNTPMKILMPKWTTLPCLRFFCCTFMPSPDNMSYSFMINFKFNSRFVGFLWISEDRFSSFDPM